MKDMNHLISLITRFTCHTYETSKDNKNIRIHEDTYLNLNCSPKSFTSCGSISKIPVNGNG